MNYDYKETAGLDKQDIADAKERLREYTLSLRTRVHGSDYEMPEAALVTPFDAAHVAEAEKVSAALGPVRHVVVVGIGGSSMGTEAVYEALVTDESPELYVLDIMDGRRLEALIRHLKKVPFEDIAIVIVSKSGTTTETLANADVLLSSLLGAFGNALYKRVVAIGNENTPLAAFAMNHGIMYSTMPGVVGGRYSVFTAVGLVPLALLGINVKELALGAAAGIEEDLDISGSAADAAAVLYGASQKGIRTHTLFPEDQRLHGFVAWYEQLLAESLGKKEDKNGTVVNAGMLPVPMSPKELHSTAQLYLSAFPNIFTTFFVSEKEKTNFTFAKEGPASLVGIEKREYDDIPNAIMGGVRKAYAVQGLPHAIIDMGALTPESLGRVMAGRMLEVIYIAHLLNIDAFDQPSVELYKQETRQLLHS